jgi:hypothetical protein
MQEKNYINGMVIKEKVFDNGGKQLKISIKVEDFVRQIESIEDNGWANILVSRRKEPSDKGVTHYAFEDTWKPEKQQADSTYGDKLPF